MRWLKHLSDAHADERMAMLRAEAGFEGYGFYWFILERIAKQIDGDDGKTSLTYPIKFWSSLAGVSTRVLKRLAETCAKLDLFSVKFSGNLMTIDCPNILKYRDEWTKKKWRNSGATPERLRSKDTDTDTEAENTPPSPPAGGVPLGQGREQDRRQAEEGDVLTPQPTEAPKPKRRQYPAAFELAWKACHEGMQNCGKGGALRSWERARRKPDYPGDQALAQLLADIRAKWEGEGREKIPHLTTWLNQGRWNTPEAAEIGREREAEHEAAAARKRQAQLEAKRKAEAEAAAADAERYWGGLPQEAQAGFIRRARESPILSRHGPESPMVQRQARWLAWQDKMTERAA